jgi:hypothetical protein
MICNWLTHLSRVSRQCLPPPRGLHLPLWCVYVRIIDDTLLVCSNMLQEVCYGPRKRFFEG